MGPLQALIGRETTLTKVIEALRACATRFDTNVIGAHLVCCSDESEVECAEVFQHEFVAKLLPALGDGKKGAFRTSNLGARYEPFSAQIAEHHYATPESRLTSKCVLIKINGHVSESRTSEGKQYGPMQRYEAESNACGALHALLGGADAPFAAELREAFLTTGKDRIATLLDEKCVAPRFRYLAAALASARLQAARAARDIEGHHAASPTVYLIVPCVTLNRYGPDGEIVCGYHIVDQRGIEPKSEYHGLGDDPALYRIEYENDALRIMHQ